jgi:endoglucanase
VVDLHILRSHFFNQSTEPPLFTDFAEATKFADLWRQLSARLAGRGNNQVAYELMNEPVAQDAADWNRVAMVAIRAIRENEPQRTIVLGSNRWNSARTFDLLKVPEDANTVLTFHFYHPMLVTHHQASWCPEGRMYDGPVQYPGRPISNENLAIATEPESSRLVSLNIAELNKPYDRDAMMADLAKPLAVARRTGLPLYCGEFGVINLAPYPVRAAWYADLISVFDELEIGWANWDYKGTFGILDRHGRSTGIAEVMLSSYAHSSNRG